MAGAITIPILGEITILGGLVSLILFIFGYVFGSSIKSGMKYALVFLIFIFALIVLGILGVDIIGNMASAIVQLKPLYEGYLSMVSGVGSVNLPLLAFVAGFLFGLVRG